MAGGGQQKNRQASMKGHIKPHGTRLTRRGCAKFILAELYYRAVPSPFVFSLLSMRRVLLRMRRWLVYHGLSWSVKNHDVSLARQFFTHGNYACSTGAHVPQQETNFSTVSSYQDGQQHRDC